MANIEITLQAASDAVMTQNNLPAGFGGTALSEGDPRKAFGLPHFYMDKESKLHWDSGARWDTVASLMSDKGADKQSSDTSLTWMNADYKKSGSTKPTPTTTAFQLRCESVQHEVLDMSAISPMPGQSVADGVNKILI
jgi:hypothetical protein